MENLDETIEEAIASIWKRAGAYSHILDMQGFTALLARVLYDISVFETMFNKSGFPRFTEDQIFAIIVNNMRNVEDVVLSSDPSSTDGLKADPSVSDIDTALSSKR